MELSFFTLQFLNRYLGCFVSQLSRICFMGKYDDQSDQLCRVCYMRKHNDQSNQLCRVCYMRKHDDQSDQLCRVCYMRKQDDQSDQLCRYLLHAKNYDNGGGGLILASEAQIRVNHEYPSSHRRAN